MKTNSILTKKILPILPVDLRKQAISTILKAIPRNGALLTVCVGCEVFMY